MPEKNLLVVSDDHSFQALLRFGLESEGYVITVAESGAKMRSELDRSHFGLIVLGLDLPDEDGLVLLRQLRTRLQTPVLVTSGRSDPDTVVSALELGADDFVARPFDTRAMLLKIKRLLARADEKKNAAILSKPKFEQWTLDLASRCLRDRHGKALGLTPSEFKLLATLVANAGHALTREQLLDAISMGEKTPSTRTIDVLVTQLRGKIERNRRKPTLISTVHGYGYRFDGKIE